MYPLAYTLLGLIALMSSAHGQTYRCASAAGTYYADRPCPSAGSTARLGAIGPSRDVSSPQRFPQWLQTRGMPKVEEHVKYLRPDCASIAEAIRTGPSRGVRAEDVEALREEYRQKCTLDDQEARKQVRADESRREQAEMAQWETAQAQRQQSEMRGAQCADMKDVISLKRKREHQLNDKEVGALRELERAYNERCIAR